MNHTNARKICLSISFADARKRGVKLPVGTPDSLHLLFSDRTADHVVETRELPGQSWQFVTMGTKLDIADAGALAHPVSHDSSLIPLLHSIAVLQASEAVRSSPYFQLLLEKGALVPGTNGTWQIRLTPGDDHATAFLQAIAVIYVAAAADPRMRFTIEQFGYLDGLYERYVSPSKCAA